MTGFAPDPELHAVTLATSTLGILYVDGGLSLAISLLGPSTSFTLLGGVIVGVLLLLSVDLGEGDLVGALDLGLFNDLEILCLKSWGFLDLDFLLPLLLDLGSFQGLQCHGNLNTEKERWVLVIALVTKV